MEAAFDALGDPTRRRILRLLAGGEQPVSSLVDELQADAPISQPAVSQHLRVLRDAGLVTARAEGRHRYHAIDPRGIEGAQAWLTALADPLTAFAQPLDALATEVARGRRARRTAPAEPGRSGGEDGRTRSA